MEVRKGKDWELISDLEYWKEKDVDAYMYSLLASFPNFLFYVFKHTIHVVPTPIQLDMADYLQHGANDNRWDKPLIEAGMKKRIENTDFGFMAFRNAGKSEVLSLFSLWNLAREPRFQIKIISNKDKAAIGMLKKVKKALECCERLEYLIPPVTPSNRKTKSVVNHSVSSDTLDVNGAELNGVASILSLSIKSTFTGERADLVILDDLETLDSAMTHTGREYTKAKVQEATNLLHKSRFAHWESKSIIVGTPHAEDSLYYSKIADGVPFRVYPARYPNKRYMSRIGHILAPMIKHEMESGNVELTGHGLKLDEGEFTCKTMCDPKKIMKVELDQEDYAKQYMLDCTAQSEANSPLKVSNLIVTDFDASGAYNNYRLVRDNTRIISDLPCTGLPEDRFYAPEIVNNIHLPFDQIIMAIDMSGFGKDETAVTVVASVNGFIFVCDTGAYGAYDRGMTFDIASEVAEMAIKWGVHLIHLEDNNTASFELLEAEFAKRNYYCTIDRVTQSYNKEARIIRALDTPINNRRLVINRSVIENDNANGDSTLMGKRRPYYNLIYQMARLTKVKDSIPQKDRLDSLAIAVEKLGHVLVDAREENENESKLKMLRNRANKNQSLGSSFSKSRSSRNW